MTDSIPERKKTPVVKISLTVSFNGKENMSLADMAEINAKVEGLVVEAEKLGNVTGDVRVGSQKYSLGKE